MKILKFKVCKHYKKSCLPGRTWSSAVVDGDHPARIFGPPWPIRQLFFFVFEALYSHGLGQNVADGRPARGRWWFLASGREVNAILCFDEHGAQMSATLANFFFSVAHLFELPRSSRLWFSIMGPRRQPHKTRKHWILGFFFTPDFWLLSFNFDPCPLVKRWGRLQADGSQMSASQNENHLISSIVFYPCYLVTRL